MVPTCTLKQEEPHQQELRAESIQSNARIEFSLDKALNGTSEEFDQVVKSLRSADPEIVSQLLDTRERSARSELQTLPATIGNISAIATLSRQLERASALRNWVGLAEFQESGQSPTSPEETTDLLAGQSLSLSKNNHLDSAIELALEDHAHFDKAIELLKSEPKETQAQILNRFEANNTELLQSLGNPTVANITEYAQATRNLEGIAALRGNLGLPKAELLSITTAVAGEGLALERKGAHEKTLHQNYSVSNDIATHHFISHGIIPDTLRSIGVELPGAFSRADEAIATGIDRSLAELAPLKYETRQRAAEILNERVKEQSASIDKEQNYSFQIG